MERVQLGEKWCFGKRESQFWCIWFSLWIMLILTCSDVVTPLNPFYTIVGNVISYWVSRCVGISCILFALPVGCVDFHLMYGIIWECAFVFEESGHQQMGMNVRYSQVLCAWNILVEFGSSSSWWISEEPCLRLCRAESSSKAFCLIFIHPFFFPFQFMQLLCWRYCSLGELWSHSQSTRGSKKKQQSL